MRAAFASSIMGMAMVLACAPAVSAQRVTDAGDGYVVGTAQYLLRIEKKGFRLSFLRPDGSIIAPAHAASGLQFGGGDATEVKLRDAEKLTFDLTSTTGRKATVQVAPGEHQVKFSAQVEGDPGKIVFRTGRIGPAFGLGDSGGLGRSTTELSGISEESLHAFTGGSLSKLSGVSRLMSNFVIFPRQGFAMVNIEPQPKVIRITKDETAQGVSSASELPAMICFIGTPPEIYRAFLDVRNQHGYRVHEPRYDWFGVGWEAWGALAWDTSQKTVTENVTRYLDAGYPLRWMIVGSGFWPRHDPKFHATTSFGLWDEKLYPDPRGLITHFHGKGLKFFIGLRIAFITDGPFAEEGVKRRAFIEDADGKPKVFNIAFPKRPVYLLDAHKPDAVKWYLELCGKWRDFGIDGFKEDLFGYQKYVFRDDKIDPVNDALMRQGYLIMGRNGYLGSPMDIHRIEDFNQNQPQDRGPINCLALAYSGFAAPYPDIVGGTFSVVEWGGKNQPPAPTDPQVKKYFTRNVRFGSVTPVMAMGYGPWNMKDPEVERVALDSAKLHDLLQPTIYSAALESTRTGYPHSFTPLPIAFPDDEQVYALENTTRRSYQWMLGPSLLATPLYGDDLHTAETRDVYLPRGQWMEWDSGKIHEGPTTLRSYELPVSKTPLFIGGAGIIVKRDQGASLRAAVYPVAPKDSELRFNHPDGKTKSRIVSRVGDWSAAKFSVVESASGKTIELRRDVHGSVSFLIEPGRDYEVRGE